MRKAKTLLGAPRKLSCSGPWVRLAVSAAAVCLCLPAAVSAGTNPTLTSGTYSVVVHGNALYHSTWTLHVANGNITGSSRWTCCPGPRTDALSGSVTSTRVTIRRDCSGQGAPASSVTPCVQVYIGTIAKDGTLSGTFTHNGQGGYTFSMHVVGGENVIEGSAYRLVCDNTSCHHAPPFGPVTVVASSGGDSASAVTDADGHYEIKSLGNGSWHVEPRVEGTLRSLPTFRDVNIQGDVDHAETGVDFNVCDERPLPNIPNGCAPVYDYSMPGRFDKASLSPSYTNPSSFTVLFELKAGCDSTSSYAWYVDGKQAVDRPGGGLCKFLIDFDKEGTYKVRVDKQDGSGEKVPYVSTVVVQDFLIVSLGDSLATGEGNPPYTDYSCDQSPKAYGAQAASKIEDADPRSSVTFVQLACSGASIDSDIAALPTLFVKDKGLLSKIQTGLGKKAVVITQGPTGANSIAYQLARLKDLIGDRQIDALTLSVGINNLDFGTIVKDCILVKRCQAAPDKYGPITLRTDLGVQVPANMKILVGLYSDLRETITALFPRAQLNPSDVYVVGYPDPLHNETGALCPIFIGTKDAGGFENLDKEDEVTWAENAFMTPLERATSDFAAGWNYIGLGSLFDKHGYCSTDTWFNQIQDFTEKKTTNPSGILHPTATGQAAIVDELLPTMKSRLFSPSGTSARKPS